MDINEVVAREAIRDLVARYNANGDTARFPQVLELFTDDAVMETDDTVFTGLAEIESLFTGTRDRLANHGDGQPSYLRHNTATHQIDMVSDTEAKGRCYYFVIMAHGLDHWGRYIDDYRLDDGRWKFARRRVTMEGNHSGGLGELSQD